MEIQVKYSHTKHGYIRVQNQNIICLTIPIFLKNNTDFYQKMLQKAHILIEKFQSKYHTHIDTSMIFWEKSESGLTQEEKINLFIQQVEKYLQFYSEKIWYKYTKFSCKYLKSKWGSCSRENAIVLNLYLLHLPRIFLEYVVAHEVAHMKVKNHSPKFWHEVEKLFPKYKEVRRELKKVKIV